MENVGSIIVSWDFSHGKDVGVLIVGKQQNSRVEIINAFQGKEAYEIYEKLTIQRLRVKLILDDLSYKEEENKHEIH